MPTEESLTLTSGKEITISLSDDGEINSFNWNVEAPADSSNYDLVVSLSENEFFEIKDWVEEYSEENDDSDDDDQCCSLLSSICYWLRTWQNSRQKGLLKLES